MGSPQEDKAEVPKPPEKEIVVVPVGEEGKLLWRKAVLYQLIYSLVGLIGGLACVGGGILLFSWGVNGSVNWTASVLGSQSKVVDAAPGVVLFLVGLFIVFTTRFGIKPKGK